MFHIPKIKLVVCNFHSACVEQQPMKIDKYIVKSPICVKPWFKVVSKMYYNVEMDRKFYA